ncbi:lysophospholipid acyltransferase family protein [Sphaerotilus mobilis]|uniref:lysophospholipid acyltransferase family protein n=1 Tax=Sphaerotilus mobilis TaxID=47994 RepID=UPI00102B5915|nr:lysophospholipid acyltransferase family protein [Sphaerotilus mobilis]
MSPSRGPLRAVLVAWLWVLVAWLGVLSLSWSVLAMLLHPVLPAAFGQRLGRAVIAWGYRFYWVCGRASGLMRIDARALDALADQPGGLIVAANHPCMADAMLIVARLPRSVCIMKAGLQRNVFLGAGARLARYIANDVPHLLVRSAVEELQAGAQLVLFPEGTRTEGDRLQPLRGGIALIAQRAQVPVQTVIIETDSPFLAKGWPIWRLPPVPMVYRLRLGQRFAAPAADDPEAPGVLMDALQSHLEQELAKQPRR